MRTAALGLARAVVGRTVTPAADALGVLDRMLRGALDGRPVWLVAMYHRILPPAEAPAVDIGLQVSEPLFNQQLEFLQQRFKVLGVGEVVRRLRSGQALPPRTASITFDDGYEDNLRVAAPILARRGLPWSLYVTTGGLLGGQALWWDRALALLAALPAGTLDLRFMGLAQFARSEPVPRGARVAWIESVLARLWQLPLALANQAMDAMEERYQLRPGGTPARLSAAQLASLCASGVEFGSHTHSHQNLALADPAAVRADVERGRSELEEICGRAVTGFAYPGGHLSAAVAAAVRDAGCDYALAVDGRINIGHTDRYRIQRVGMPNAPLHNLKLALVRHLRRGPATFTLPGAAGAVVP